MGKTTTGLMNVENRWYAKPNSIADEELHIYSNFQQLFLGLFFVGRQWIKHC
jgi:hypothetical protein